jgi:hypothetical protein
MSTPTATSLPSVRQLFLATPFYLLIPVGFGLLPLVWNQELLWKLVGLGTAAWVVALILRGPVALIANKKASSNEVAQRWVILSSGPLEELIRLCTLTLVSKDFISAYSIGLGWGGIEVIYAVLSGYLITTVIHKNDEEAIQLREYLQELGMLTETAPFLGIIERFSATAFHIGFTLLLAKWSLFILPGSFIHSGFNLGTFMMLRYNPVGVQIVIAVIGITFFILGLAVFMQL